MRAADRVDDAGAMWSMVVVRDRGTRMPVFRFRTIAGIPAARTQHLNFSRTRHSITSYAPVKYQQVLAGLSIVRVPKVGGSGLLEEIKQTEFIRRGVINEETKEYRSTSTPLMDHNTKGLTKGGSRHITSVQQQGLALSDLAAPIPPTFIQIGWLAPKNNSVECLRVQKCISKEIPVVR